MADHDFSNTSRRLGAAALDLISDHAELFALELQEQKQHSSQQLLWMGIAAACAFMLFCKADARVAQLVRKSGKGNLAGTSAAFNRS